MKRWIPVVVATAAVVSIWASSATRAQPDPARGIMRLKLDHAQRILEGIAVSDFDRIDREAQALKALTLQASWKAIDDPRYLDYSLRLRKALEAMSQQAKAKNLDGVAFNYVQVTMTCVDCHKFIRDSKKVDADSAVSNYDLAAVQW